MLPPLNVVIVHLAKKALSEVCTWNAAVRLHTLAGGQDFLKANVRATGYFRVSYSPGLWARIATAAAAPRTRHLFSQACSCIIRNSQATGLPC